MMVSPTIRSMRLGEAYQLVLREVQHEVWKRRSRGETASTISHHLGIDVDTVHAWFLEWSAKQDAAYQLTRPTGDPHRRVRRLQLRR